MKTVFLACMCTAILGGFGIYVKTQPRSGKGALTTFKKDMRLHNYLEMDSTTDSYIRLLKQMGLIAVDGKSELVFQGDEFCIARDTLGYFPAVLRKGKLPCFLKKVYLKPKEGVTDEMFFFVHEYEKNTQDHQRGQIRQIDSTSTIMGKNHYQLFEDIYPNEQFPKTLRRGAGIGSDAKSSYFVSILQQTLLINGYPTRTDGMFDRDTENAVKKFQRDYGLIPDGIVGNETLKVLQIGPYRPKDSWLEMVTREIKNLFA